MTDAPTVEDVEGLDAAEARREGVSEVADRLRRVAASDREGAVFERLEACRDALAAIEKLPAAGTVLAPLVSTVLREALAADAGGRGRELFLGAVSNELEAVATRVLTTSLSATVVFDTAATTPALSLRSTVTALVETLLASESEDARASAVDGLAQASTYRRDLVVDCAVAREDARAVLSAVGSTVAATDVYVPPVGRGSGDDRTLRRRTRLLATLALARGEPPSTAPAVRAGLTHAVEEGGARTRALAGVACEAVDCPDPVAALPYGGEGGVRSGLRRAVREDDVPPAALGDVVDCAPARAPPAVRTLRAHVVGFPAARRRSKVFDSDDALRVRRCSLAGDAATLLGVAQTAAPDDLSDVVASMRDHVRTTDGDAESLAAKVLGTLLVEHPDVAAPPLAPWLDWARSLDRDASTSPVGVLGAAAATAPETPDDVLATFRDRVRAREDTGHEQAARTLGELATAVPDALPGGLLPLVEHVRDSPPPSGDLSGFDERGPQSLAARALGEAVAADATTGPEALDALRSRARSREDWSTNRSRIARALGEAAVAFQPHVDPALGPLLERVEATSGDARRGATRALAEVTLTDPGSPVEGVRGLVAAADTDDPFAGPPMAVVGEAVVAVPDAAPDRLEPLRRAVGESDLAVYEDAAEALGEAVVAVPDGAEDVVDPLVSHAEATTADSQRRAERALGYLLDVLADREPAVDRLRASVRATEWSEHRGLAAILGDVVADDPEFAPDCLRSLCAHVRETDGQRRVNAVRALGATVAVDPEDANAAIGHLVEVARAAIVYDRDMAVEALGEAAIALPEGVDSRTRRLITAVRSADGERREHGAEAVGEVVLENADTYVQEVAAMAWLGREHEDPRARAKYATQLRVVASTGMFTLEEFLTQLEAAADASDGDGLAPYLDANAAARTNVLEALIVAVDRADAPRLPDCAPQLREFLADPDAASGRARLLAVDVLAALEDPATANGAGSELARSDSPSGADSSR